MDEAEIDRSRRVVLTHRPPLVAGSPMGRRQTSHPLDRHRQRRRGWSIAGALVTGTLMAWMSVWVWMGSVSRTENAALDAPLLVALLMSSAVMIATAETGAARQELHREVAACSRQARTRWLMGRTGGAPTGSPQLGRPLRNTCGAQ